MTTERVHPRVRDVMTAPVAVVEPGTRVRQALELMRRNQIRHLPVVADGVLVGFVSQNDLRETLGFQNDDWQVKERLDWAVLRVMNEDCLKLTPETLLSDAIDQFLCTKAGAVPVVNQSNGELVGILSTLDVLRAAKNLF